MARKTKAGKEAEAFGWVIIIIAPAFLSIWWIQNNIKPPQWADFVSFCIAGACLLIIVIAILHRNKKIKRQNEQAENLAAEIILQHEKALGLQCLHKIRKDAYGTEDASKWQQEVNHFFSTKLSSILRHNSMESRSKCLLVIDGIGRREKKKLEEAERSDPDALFSCDMPSANFEKYCGTILNKAGWEVDVTGASGEQGADIIARKENIKAVFQCKLYKKRAVGNAAVRQAQRAKVYYEADLAVVVGDTGFSEAAQTLATAAQIILLDHRELRSWANEAVSVHMGEADEE